MVHPIASVNSNHINSFQVPWLGCWFKSFHENEQLRNAMENMTTPSNHSILIGKKYSSISSNREKKKKRLRKTVGYIHRFPVVQKDQLVGGFNPFEKHARQIGSFPQIGVNIKIFETTTQKTSSSSIMTSPSSSNVAPPSSPHCRSQRILIVPVPTKCNCWKHLPRFLLED